MVDSVNVYSPRNFNNGALVILVEQENPKKSEALSR